MSRGINDIETQCEGSLDVQPYRANGAVMCAMCGKWFAAKVVPAHRRLDILGMIDQGKVTP
jgi:hypothetical protein